MEELYKEYGQLMIECEIVQAKINHIKTKIAEELNKGTVGESKESTSFLPEPVDPAT